MLVLTGKVQSSEGGLGGPSPGPCYLIDLIDLIEFDLHSLSGFGTSEIEVCSMSPLCLISDSAFLPGIGSLQVGIVY